MKEKIFNLFLFINDDIIQQLGVVSHECDGTDEQKTKFLQSQVDIDLPNAQVHPVPQRYVMNNGTSESIPGQISYDGYQQLKVLGRQLDFFEDIFKLEGALDTPLVCITPVRDGKPAFDIVSDVAQ